MEGTQGRRPAALGLSPRRLSRVARFGLMSLPRSLKISKIAEVKKGALFSRSARKRRFRHAERA